MARIAFLLVTLFGCVGCGDGSDKVIVVGNQGPRVDHTAVAIGDFNGDGYNDLVAASSYVTLGPGPNTDEINVYLQNPRNPGSFSARTDYRIGSDLSLQTLSIADLELDQLPDVVAWSITDGHLRIMLQKPSDPGELSPPAIYPTPGGNSSSGRYAIADLNPDGLPDIAAFGVEPEYSVSEDLLVYIQSPMVPGVFQAPMRLRMGGVTGRDLVLADLDDDGMQDIAASGNITETFDIGD